MQRHAVVLQVNALIFPEFVHQPIDDAKVEVVTAQEGVAVGGLHFEHAVPDFEDRNIERAAAEVVDGDALFFLFLQAVGQ